jgi:predicted regulator of Ras-like GTPase activity (Roadblock/LC7/MglB family)
MENGLNEIKSVQGVRGCFVADNGGQIYAKAAVPGLDDRNLQEISRLCLESLVAVDQVEDQINELDFSTPEATVLVRDHNSYFLVILCDHDVNTSLVRISINVVTSQWAEDKKIQRRIESHHQVREVL